MLIMEMQNPDGSVPAWVRDTDGNWHLNATPEVRQYLQEAMQKMADDLTEAKVLEALADIQDELAEAAARAELAEQKADAVYASIQNLVASIDEHFDMNIAPVIAVVEQLADWAEESDGESEAAWNAFVAITDILKLDLKQIAARVRAGAVDRGSNGSEFGKNVPGSNHSRNLASVSNASPRPPVNDVANRDGYVREDVTGGKSNGVGMSLVEASVAFLNRSAKYGR